MGIHVSKPKGKSLLRRKKKAEVKSNSSSAERAQTRRKYVSGWALLARPWDIVCEEPYEKWRKSKAAVRFGNFPVCTRKTQRDSQVIGGWYSDACHEVSRDKTRSLITYQPHGATQRQTFPYTANNLLEKTLNQGSLQKVIQSTGGFLALYFTYHSLEDRTYGITPLFNMENSELLYFFVDKSVPYQPKGLAVSPDSTMVCLLLTRTIQQPDKPPEEDFEVQVYSRRPMAFDKSFHGPTFELEYEVPGLRPNKGCPKVMFDPRYYSSRLGIINVNTVQSIRVTHYFMVYDLRHKRPLTMPNENYVSDVDDLDLLDAAYSPDGQWVHALVGHVAEGVVDKHIRALWVINSDTLEIVRAIEVGREYIEGCYMNYVPIYSTCTRQMALRHRKFVKLYKLPAPDTLKARCRAVILANYRDSVDRLDTSQDVIDYIKLKPYRR